MTQRVKILLLAGLLLILGAQVFFGGLEPDDSDIVAVLETSGNTTPLGSPKSTQTSTFSLPSSKDIVKLATPRNIFAPLTEELSPMKAKPVPPPPLPPTKPKPAVVAKPPAPQPVLPRGPTPEELARLQEEKARIIAEKEMSRYRFLGYLERAGEQHVFLSNGQALYIVKPGEMLEGAITLKTIDDTSVVLSKLLTGMNTTAEATLSLTKDE